MVRIKSLRIEKISRRFFSNLNDLLKKLKGSVTTLEVQCGLFHTNEMQPISLRNVKQLAIVRDYDCWCSIVVGSKHFDGLAKIKKLLIRTRCNPGQSGSCSKVHLSSYEQMPNLEAVDIWPSFILVMGQSDPIQWAARLMNLRRLSFPLSLDGLLDAEKMLSQDMFESSFSKSSIYYC